ncbi:MAG: metalloregulator ArsR/SmtB family transcription factor, partial [Fusobacterium mortiferum]
MNKFEEAAKIFKAFCDPNRLMILEILKDGEQCACKLLEQLNIGQPTLSH